jgi:TonB family protein
MLIRLSFLIVFLFLSYKTTDTITLEEYEPRTAPPTTWTYEEAKALYDQYPEEAKQELAERNMTWAEYEPDCDPDRSFFPFLENGTMELQRKIEYPRQAREEMITGKVRLIYTIDSLGVPGDYRILDSPSPLLTRSVLNAVDESYYVPGYCNGQAASVVHYFTFSFNAFTIRNNTITRGLPRKQF